MLAELMAARLAGERDIEVIETRFAANQFVTGIATARPDVLVLDPRKDPRGLVATIRDLRRASARTRVVVLTGPTGDHQLAAVTHAVREGLIAQMGL